MESPLLTMKDNRELAKDTLNTATKTKYYGIVDEAKIFKEDQKILHARFIDGLSITAISEKYGYSVEKINKVIMKCYDKIYNVITGA